MVSRDSGCFQCSRWFVVIIGMIYVLLGGICLLGGAILLISPSEDPHLKGAVVFVYVIVGVVLLAFGLLGVCGGVMMNLCLMMTFAITASISLGLAVLGGVAVVDNSDGIVVVRNGISILLAIPTVICSWIVVCGLQNSPKPQYQV